MDAHTRRWCTTATRPWPGASTDLCYRRQRLSAVALQGPLNLVAAVGGIVEGYPNDTGGKKKSVLCSGTRTLFERAGFEYIRNDGLGDCVMRRTVP
jgi:hypothetical protein